MSILSNFGVDYKITELNNGVKLHLFYKPNSPIYFRAYFYAGSQYDGDKPGLAHFCEHIILSGTEKYPTNEILNRKVEEAGIKRNAFTGAKNMWFTYDLADKADLPEMFEIVDETLNHSIFRPEAIERERGVILAEQTKKISNPSANIFDLQNSLLFQGTNIENPVLGSDESVKSFTREELIAYRDKYIVNGKVAYFISGDFDEEIVINSLNKINGNRKPIELPDEELPIILNKKEFILKTENPKQNYISLCTRIKSVEDKTERVCGSVFSNIFGQGTTSRLYIALRDNKGIVYGVSAGAYSNSEFATLSINTDCKPTDTAEVINIIKNELEKIISDGIDELELLRSRKNILRNIKFQSETASFWVDKSKMKELTGQKQPMLEDEYIEILKSVTVNDVNSYMKKYIANKELLLVGIGDFSHLK